MDEWRQPTARITPQSAASAFCCRAATRVARSDIETRGLSATHGYPCSTRAAVYLVVSRFTGTSREGLYVDRARRAGMAARLLANRWTRQVSALKRVRRPAAIVVAGTRSLDRRARSDALLKNGSHPATLGGGHRFARQRTIGIDVDVAPAATNEGTVTLVSVGASPISVRLESNRRAWRRLCRHYRR